MNGDHVFRGMFWKDYRELRAFWLAIVLLAIALEGCAAALASSRAGLPNFAVMPMLVWALLFSALYALGCAAVMFAGERESGTYGFVQALPASPRRLLAGRLAFALASTLLALVVLTAFGVRLVLRRAPHVEPGNIPEVLGTLALLPLELFAWGMLFSLVCRRALVAAMLGGAAGAIVFWIIVANVSDLVDPAPWWPAALPIRAIVVVLVAVADAWLASRWFSAEGLLRRRVGVESLLPGEAAPWRRRWRSAARELGRFVWQQGRQSWRLLTGFVIAAVLLAAFITPLAPAWIALGGACVFRDDWQENRFRFLAEHGARPGRVWLGRQALWLAVVTIMASVFTAVLLAVHEKPMPHTPLGEVLLVCALLVFTAYACGQFCSLYLRSSILAGLSSLVLLGIAASWAGFVLALRVPAIWSVAPLPIILLIATRLRVRDWMLERTDWRARTTAVLVPLVPIIVLLVAVPIYRVYSVPGGGPGFSVEEFTRPPTPEEAKTARMYEEAWDAYRPMKAGESPEEIEESHRADRITFTFREQPLSPREVALLDASQKTIELAVRASRRPECMLSHFERGFGDHDLPYRVLVLGDLLVLSARRLSLEGKLEAALDRYLSALRISIHIESRSMHLWSGEDLRQEVQKGLLAWAARPGQTPERIRRALDEVTRLQAKLPSADGQIKLHWLRNQQELAEGGAGSIPGNGRWDEIVQWMALKWLPWERARAQRIADCLTRHSLPVFRSSEKAVLGGKQFQDLPEDPWLKTVCESTYLGNVFPGEGRWHAREFVFDEMRWRALRLQLALAAWRREHGRVPKSLDELVGTYLDTVPIDPFTGKPFRYLSKGISKATMLAHHDAIDHYWTEDLGPFLWSPGRSTAPSLESEWEVLRFGPIFPIP